MPKSHYKKKICTYVAKQMRIVSSGVQSHTRGTYAESHVTSIRHMKRGPLYIPKAMGQTYPLIKCSHSCEMSIYPIVTQTGMHVLQGVP